MFTWEQACGGSQICVHNKRRYSCIECNFTSILAAGRICYICREKLTRYLVCGECARGMHKNSSVVKRIRAERLFELGINRVLPGAIFTRQVHVGGKSCRTNIDGISACEEKTKAAFVDMNIVKHDHGNIILNIILEIDEEGGHGSREPTCELVRLEALKYGFIELFPTIIIRVNSDDSNSIPMESKIRATVQFLHTLLQ